MRSREKIKKFLETNENEHTTAETLRYTVKAVLRGKFIAINTGLSKKDRNISNKQPNPTATGTGGTITKTAQSKYKEGNNQDQSRIKYTEAKKTIQRINKSRSWFFENINKIDKPLSRLIKKKRERGPK